MKKTYNSPNQISLWKRDFLDIAKRVLEAKKESKSAKEEQKSDVLYAKIGQLQMEPGRWSD